MVPFSAYSSLFREKPIPWCQDPFCSVGWLGLPLWLTSLSLRQAMHAHSLFLLHVFALLPHLYPTDSFLVHQCSSLKLSYVLSMVVNIYLPKKLLFLNAYCLCGCLCPLLTWTPWIIPQNLPADWMIAYWTLWPGRLCKLNSCLAAWQELVLKTLSSKDFTWCS